MNDGTTQAHTPEPWKASGEYWTPAGWLGIAEGGADVAMAKDADIQRRIVACVNFCQDVPTEQLEDGFGLVDVAGLLLDNLGVTGGAP